MDLGLPLYRPTGDEVARASSVLAKAFENDPYYCHFFPDIDKRRQALTILFRVFMQYCKRHGVLDGSSEHLEGVIALLPQGADQLSDWALARCGAWRIPIQIGFGFARSQVPISKFLLDTRRILAPQDYLYLWLIGVAPQNQRQGNAKKLLGMVIARLAELQLPCYFEAFNEEDIHFYRHFGLEPEACFDIPGHDLKLWVFLAMPDDYEAWIAKERGKSLG